MKSLLLLFLALLLPPVSEAADSIEMIDLHNRPAEEIIPIIKPMLDSDASISGQGFTLIIRTSATNLEQIRGLVSQIDTAARQLLVSVFQGTEREVRALGLEGSLHYEGSDIDVRAGQKSSRPGGGTVQYNSGNSNISAGGFSTRARLSDNPVHRLRVAEGTEGYIETGQSIPFFSGNVYRTPRRTAVEAGVEYKDVTTGFYVFPRVHGDQVTLEVSPFKNNLSRTRGDAINTQRAATTVTGKLGEWLQIGGIDEQVERTRSGVGSYTSTGDRSSAGIWIKADLAE